MNANQPFKWRRAFERGELNEPCSALLPVAIPGTSEPQGEPPTEEHRAAAASGSIHIHLQGRAVITVESGADSALVGQILESLRK